MWGSFTIRICYLVYICIRFHGGGRGVSHETRVWESASVPLRAGASAGPGARAAGGDLAPPSSAYPLGNR